MNVVLNLFAGLTSDETEDAKAGSGAAVTAGVL